MHTATVISYFVIWTSLSPLSYYNGCQRTQRNKQAAAGVTRHITFTIQETLEKIRKHEVLHARVSLCQHITMDCRPSKT